MAILLNVPEYEILIGEGVDELDVTPVVKNFTLRWPRAEFNSAYILRGGILLDRKLGTQLSRTLNDLEDPTFWDSGQKIRVYIRGTLFHTCRISRYFWDDETFEGSIEVTDLLGLCDSVRPPAEIEGIELGGATPWYEAGKLALTQAGLINGTQYLSTIGTGTATGGESYEVPLIKFNGSFVKLAQQITGERGWWWWCNRDEEIELIQYPPDTATPLYCLSRDEVTTFKRQSGLEKPLAKIIVAGSAQKIASCPADNPKYEPEYGTRLNGEGDLEQYLARLTTTTTSSLGDTDTVTIQKQAITGLIYVDLPVSDPWELMTWHTETQRRVYNDEGKLAKLSSTRSSPLGVISSTTFSGSQVVVFGAELYSEDYEYTDGVLTRKTSTRRWPTYRLYTEDVYSDTPTYLIQEQIVETWENAANSSDVVSDTPTASCQKYEYLKRWYQRPIDASFPPEQECLVLVNEPIPKEQRPPEPPVREPLYPLDTVAIKGEASFQLVGGSPYAPTEDTFSCSTLLSDVECTQYATLIGNLQHQRYRSRLVTHSFNDYLLDNFKPFYVTHIHNASMVADTPVLAMEGKRLTWAFIGNYQGDITTIAPPPEPLWIPAAGLDIAPIGNRTFFVGVQIRPILLQATGGTPGYTFSSLTLPAGLSIVGSYIVGTPSAAAVTAVTVTVTDSVAATDTTSCTFTTVAPRVPANPVTQLLAIDAEYSAYTVTTEATEVFVNLQPSDVDPNFDYTVDVNPAGEDPDYSSYTVTIT